MGWSETANQIVSKLPSKSLIAISSALIVLMLFFIFIAAYSIYSGNQVEFLSLKIGPGNKTLVISQLPDAIKELKEVRNIYSKRILLLENEIINIRSQIIKLNETPGTQKVELQLLERKYLNEIESINKQFVKLIDEKIESIDRTMEYCK